VIVGLDLETTGVNPKKCDILEIALVGVKSNLTEVFSFHSLCRTEKPFKVWVAASKVHGITPRVLEGVPSWGELKPVVEQLLSFRPLLIVGHNVVRYDSVILRQHGIKAVDCCTFVDTMTELVKPGEKWLKLEEAAKKFGVESPGEAHTALHDVWLSLKVAKAAGFLEEL